MKRFPALFLSLFFFLFTFIIFSSKTFAQTTQNYPPAQVNQTQSTNPYIAPNTEANVPNNLHTYTQSVMIEVMAGLVCQLSGIDPTSKDGKCLGVDPKSGKIGFVQSGGGAVGVMGHMISMFYTPPAHTTDFIAYAGQNFGLIKHSYAQSEGVGLTGLSPLTGLWTKMRDVVYLLFVLVFVVVGVAIMLRVRIDPRTVMTVQNQIPKIIIALLLVTFSLAIAGFLIDIMYIFIYLIINVFGMEIPNLYTSPFGVAQDMFGIFHVAFGASYSVGGIVAGLTDAIMGSTIGKIVTTLGIISLAGLTGPAAPFVAGGAVACSIAQHLPNIADIPGLGFIDKMPVLESIPFIGSGGGVACEPFDAVRNLPGIIVGGLVGMIAFLVILIALIWALFRIWFALLGAYIGILIDVIFAPFWIVAGLFPGSSISFTAWLRHLVSNLSAFPAVLVMFILADQISNLFGSNSGKMFVPPFIGNPSAQSHFGAIIALGFILATPNMVKTMRNAFQIKPGEPSTIGMAINAGASVPGRAVTGTADAVTTPHFDKKSGHYIYPENVFAKAWRAYRGAR